MAVPSAERTRSRASRASRARRTSARRSAASSSMRLAGDAQVPRDVDHCDSSHRRKDQQFFLDATRDFKNVRGTLPRASSASTPPRCTRAMTELLATASGADVKIWRPEATVRASSALVRPDRWTDRSRCRVNQIAPSSSAAPIRSPLRRVPTLLTHPRPSSSVAERRVRRRRGADMRRPRPPVEPHERRARVRRLGRTRAPAETHGRAPRPHPWRRRRARDARRDSSARVQQRQQIPRLRGRRRGRRAVGPEAQEQAEDVDWAPRWRPRRDVQSGGSASRVGRRRRRRRPALADIRPRRRGDDRGRRDDDGRRRGSNRRRRDHVAVLLPAPEADARVVVLRRPRARVGHRGSKALARPRRRRERGATRDGDVAGGVLADDRRCPRDGVVGRRGALGGRERAGGERRRGVHRVARVVAREASRLRWLWRRSHTRDQRDVPVVARRRRRARRGRVRRARRVDRPEDVVVVAQRGGERGRGGAAVRDGGARRRGRRGHRVALAARGGPGRDGEDGARGGADADADEVCRRDDDEAAARRRRRPRRQRSGRDRTPRRTPRRRRRGDAWSVS